MPKFALPLHRTRGIALLSLLFAGATGCAASPWQPAIRVDAPHSFTASDEARSTGPRRAKARPVDDGGDDYGDDDDDGGSWFLDFLFDGDISLHFDGDPGLSEGDRGGLVLGVHRVPAIGLRPDLDRGEPYYGQEIDADWRTGDGAMFEIGLRQGFAGVGFLFVSTEQFERLLGQTTELRAGFLEARLHAEAGRGGLESTMTLAGGVGFAGVYFEDPDADTYGAGVSLRGTLGLRLARHLGFEVGVGYLGWGVPGEMIGEGTYLTTGLTWHPR